MSETPTTTMAKASFKAYAEDRGVTLGPKTEMVSFADGELWGRDADGAWFRYPDEEGA